MHLLEELKEPEVDMVSILRSRITSSEPKRPKISSDQAESLCGYLYNFIIQNTLSNMFPPRVNLEKVREKSQNFLSQEKEDNAQEEESCASSSNEEAQSDVSFGLSEFIKINTDSSDVIQYCKDVFRIVRQGYVEDIRKNLVIPIQTDYLSLLRAIQGSEYDIDPPEEYIDPAIIKIALY